VCAQCGARGYCALSNKRYANVGDYLHRHQAMQLCVVLPLELLDRIQDSDMVYLQKSPLTF
jgi:hypothetical protein